MVFPDMLADTVRNLTDHRLGRRHVRESVKNPEVMDRTVGASKNDGHPRILKTVTISFTLIAQHVVLIGDQESRWEFAQ